MRRLSAFLVLACVAGLALTGCSSAAKTPDTSSVPASASSSTTAPSSTTTAPSSSAPATGAYSQGAEKGGGVATLAKSNQIVPGMTFDAVVKLMGAPGKKLGEVKIGAVTGSMYVWYGAKPDTSVLVQFSNGAVTKTSAIGLK